MGHPTSATRARKNARRLFDLAPHLLQRKAGRQGGAIPMGILKNLHRWPADRLRKLWRGDPDLLRVAAQMHKEYAGRRNRSLFGDPPFFGRVFFVRLQLVTPSGAVLAHTNADMQTAVQYATMQQARYLAITL